VFIGNGVRVEGKIVQESQDDLIVIAGKFAGDIVSAGRVIVEKMASSRRPMSYAASTCR